MRIRVLGDCDSAKAVRGYLIDGGLLVDDTVYGYTVEIEETDSTIPVIDAIDSKLESAIVNAVAMLAGTQILLDRPGPNRSDTHIRISVPRSFSIVQKDAVERGIRGGFENMLKIGKPGQMVIEQQPTPTPVAPINLSEVCGELKAIVAILSAKPKEAPRSWWQRLFS